VTVEKYFAEVRRLGLRPSEVPNVYLTALNEVQHVPNPEKQTPDQRAETIRLLKTLLGVSD